MQVPYAAEDIPAGLPPAVSDFLQDQLRKISAALTEPDIFYFQETNIAPTKPQSGDIRLADGTNWNPGAGKNLYRYDATWTPIDRVLARTSAMVEVVNTTTETEVFNYSVYSGVLSTNRGLRITLLGDHLNNSGSGADLTIRVKLGATTLLTFLLYPSTGNIASSASRYTMRLSAEILNISSASIQHANGMLLTDAGATSYNFSAGAEDTTSAKTLSITAQHATANANISFRSQYCFVELL